MPAGSGHQEESDGSALRYGPAAGTSAEGRSSTLHRRQSDRTGEFPFWRMAAALSPPSLTEVGDRKSTRLNSSHVAISYAVFCLQKKSCTQSRTGGANDR